jgi:hypothetical protein
MEFSNHNMFSPFFQCLVLKKNKNSVASSPQANYIDQETAFIGEVSANFLCRGVSHG